MRQMGNMTLELAAFEEKTVMRQLLSLYKYDFTDYLPDDINEHGLFEYKYLDHYWTETGRFPFFLRVDGRLAGLALVRRFESGDQPYAYDMAEFFVMRKYRRSGLGRSAAVELFDRFPGRWTVRQVETNVPSQAFWRNVIRSYTGGSYEEIRREDWDGPIQTFVSGGRSADGADPART
ncbi:GNAT family N-acetyltransferase [Paenibacillus sp. HJGM_3]|uniref:GNAT family N-acetyltransferase n=1 Tax=Paenibacillus sp. HJGM_3 TaxID=3379816 RepID=UPI00386CB677